MRIGLSHIDMESETSYLTTPTLLVATVIVASVMNYFMYFAAPSNSDSAIKDERYKGNEYFRAVVGEVSELAASSGMEQGCTWSQTNEEVHVCVPLAADVRSKDCHCKVVADKLVVTIRGSVMLHVSQ